MELPPYKSDSEGSGNGDEDQLQAKKPRTEWDLVKQCADLKERHDIFEEQKYWKIRSTNRTMSGVNTYYYCINSSDAKEKCPALMRIFNKNESLKSLVFRSNDHNHAENAEPQERGLDAKVKEKIEELSAIGCKTRAISDEIRKDAKFPIKPTAIQVKHKLVFQYN